MGNITEKVHELKPWECLMKQLLWKQLGDIENKKILDFGSGFGVTAAYLAEKNEVTAVEPDGQSIANRWQDYPYTQLQGSVERLKELEDESFDVIICHNVLEYALERKEILAEFSRLLKPDGFISLCKHHRPGRVMQTVVLLDDFVHAKELLAGQDGKSGLYGTIHYYEDEDIEKWCGELKIVKTLGLRTFWDMQQNQDKHGDRTWQEQMIEMEMLVSDIEVYKQIAFLHHLTIRKR